MRPVFVRELAELAPICLALTVVAVLVAIETVSPGQDYDEIVTAVLVFGCALGLVQGGFERWRAGDLFFRHRPVSALRFEVARTLAGVLAVVVPVVVLVLVHRVATAQSIAERQRDFSWLGMGWELPRQLTGGEIMLLFGLATGGWSAVRYGLARRLALLAIFFTGALALALWAMASRIAAPAAAAAFAGGAALFFAVLQVLDGMEARS